MNYPSIAISVINYNSKENLRMLFKSIIAQDIKNLTIWLVDNNSPDNGGASLKKEFPKINFIQSDENGGFAKGHNLVLKKIDSDYILLINPDVEVPQGGIAKIIQFMEDNSDCAVSSCKLINTDNSIQSNGGDLPLGLPLLAWLFNLEMLPGLEKITGNFHRTDSQYYEQAHKVGWVGGTFMLIRKEILKKVGFLPEDYFMYFEDADYCYQVQKKGFKVMINPQVTIKHSGGASSKDPRFAQFKGEAIGLEIFYHKYFDSLTAMIIKFLLLVSLLMRVIAFAIIGRPAVAKTYWRVLNYV